MGALMLHGVPGADAGFDGIATRPEDHPDMSALPASASKPEAA
jgi:hypothetical protein